MIGAGRGEGERFETCVNVVQEALPIALARPYSQFVLPPGTKVSCGYTSIVTVTYNYCNNIIHSYCKHSILNWVSISVGQVGTQKQQNSKATNM